METAKTEEQRFALIAQGHSLGRRTRASPKRYVTPLKGVTKKKKKRAVHRSISRLPEPPAYGQYLMHRDGRIGIRISNGVYSSLRVLEEKTGRGVILKEHDLYEKAKPYTTKVRLTPCYTELLVPRLVDIQKHQNRSTATLVREKITSTGIEWTDSDGYNLDITKSGPDYLLEIYGESPGPRFISRVLLERAIPFLRS